MADDNPRGTGNKGERRRKDGDPANNAEPLIVTIEPQTKSKYSYEAKQYRLERARYRLEKKAYRATHCTMVFLIVYTGLTLIVAIMSVIQAIVAHQGWSDNRKQASAYLTIENFNPIVVENDPNFRVKGDYSIRNVGGTAALAITAPPPQGGIGIYYPNYHVTRPMWGGPYLPIGPTIGAGGISDHLGTFDMGSDKTSVLEGKAYYSLLIVVGYRNIFGEQLIATECRVYSPSEKSWQSCNPAPRP
ncbi:MAG TPA: hypothetical protein VN950_13345 [Terriglobales bacterium]|nr:hypothetical protein [Terriglobales bacterium]